MSGDNVPPVNLAFERQVLGAAINSTDGLVKVTSDTTADDYFHIAHKAILRALSEYVANGTEVDAILLARRLERDKSLPEDVDPYGYVGELVSDASPLAALPERIADIRACAQGRDLIAMGRNLITQAADTNGDPEAVQTALLDADDALRAMTDKVVTQPWESIEDLVEKAQHEQTKPADIPTGFIDLDRLLQGGLRKSQMVVVAARPAQGKSTLGLDVCRHAAIGKDKPGLFVSLEMNGSELAMRLMAAEGKVPLTNIRENQISAREEDQLIKVIDRVKGAPLYVLDKIEPSWPTIRSAIISAHRRLGIEFVLLDYLQLVESDGSTGSNVSREQVVSRISRGLKALARSLDICVIVIAQLNRGPEQRTDKRPMASDLRESGQIEQDSDIIMLIFQPQTHDPTTTRVGEADIIVAKHRNGPTGDVTLAFQGHYARFADMARVDAYPQP